MKILRYFRIKINKISPYVYLYIFIFSFGLLVTEFIKKIEIEKNNQLINNELMRITSEIRATIEIELNSNLFLTTGLISYIHLNNGKIDSVKINKILFMLSAQGKHVRNLGLAPNNVLRYIQPIYGNEAAIGLKYKDIPKQWPDVEKAMLLRRPVLSGPVHLVQGGRGLVYRIPIFLNNKDYWGLLSIVLDYDNIWDKMNLNSLLAKIEYRISSNDTIIFQSRGKVPDLSVTQSIITPGGEWTFHAGMKDQDFSYSVWAIRLIGWLFISVLLFLIARIQRKSLRIQRAERRLTKAVKDAKKANQAKSLFLANMSHEIRTPMNAVLGFAALMQDTSLNKVQSDYLQKILLSGKTLLGIIDNILDITKIEANKIVLEHIDCSVEKLIEEIYTINEMSAKQKGIELKVEYSDSLKNVIIQADPLRLKQVFINLINNSIKFTSQGYVLFKVETIKQEKDNISLAFMVKDTGIGMSKKVMDHLFQPFSQADNSMTRKYGGTGLGLVIARSLLRLMNSDLQLTSHENEGTCFRCEISFNYHKHNVKQIEANPEMKNNRFDGKKVLLVEDNSMNQILAEKILLSFGICIVKASNGQEALVKISSDIDLVLMDIQMPELDGIQTTKRIRAMSDYNNLPIIALTANASKEDREICLASGMNDYLVKPYSYSMLQEILTKYLI